MSNFLNNTSDLEKILKTIENLPKTITSTTEIAEGSESPYPEGSLYIVYEE